MGISTIGRTLEGIDAFERREAEHFADLAGRAHDQGTVLVALWLAGRKPHVQGLLSNLRRAEVDVIVKSPIFEELFVADPARWLEERRLPDDASAEALIDLAIEGGRLLLDCARHLAEQRLALEVRDFAGSFQAIALRELKELKKIRALHYF
jgi:hypothetical protein